MIDNIRQVFFTSIYLKEFVLATVVALPTYMLKVPNNSRVAYTLNILSYCSILEIHACNNPSPIFPNIVSTWSGIRNNAWTQARVARHVSHGNTIIVFVSARSARYYAIQPSPSRSEVRARKKRGCSTRLGPRSDVTAKGASERLADFSIFNMAENLYIHSNNFVNTTMLWRQCSLIMFDVYITKFKLY
jgi:hypothetical protein